MNNYETPIFHQAFLKWVLLGPYDRYEFEFAHAFVNIIIKESQGFSEVRVIFDRYVASSLKSYTRTTHRAGDSIQYKIHDKSKIGHLETKEFLANNETKNDLTQYLAEKW